MSYDPELYADLSALHSDFPELRLGQIIVCCAQSIHEPTQNLEDTVLRDRAAAMRKHPRFLKMAREAGCVMPASAPKRKRGRP